MSTQDLQSLIFCPDCGGVVGATTTTDNGPPCKCFADAPRPKSAAPKAPAPSPLSLSDPIPLAEPTPIEPNLADDLSTGTTDDTNGLGSSGATTAASARAKAGDGTAITDAEPPKQEKYCAICGKDVAGHRRLKDSRGYICLDCAKAEKAAGKPQGVACPKCKRIVKEDSITAFNGDRMCQRCLREARELTRPGSKRFRKIDDRHFEEHSKTQLIVLAVVAAVLGVFILIGWLTK